MFDYSWKFIDAMEKIQAIVENSDYHFRSAVKHPSIRASTSKDQMVAKVNAMKRAAAEIQAQAEIMEAEIAKMK